MQGVASTIALAYSSLAQHVAPIIAAGVGAAVVYHQRSSLNSCSSSLTLPRQRPRVQPSRAMYVARKGPVAPQRQHSFLFDEGDQISVLSDASTPFLSGNLGSLSNSVPLLPKRRRLLPAAKAFDPARHGFLHIKFNGKTMKPKWWWRTLSCLPYLMALYKAWMYVEHSYYAYPFLADLKFLINPYLSTIWGLPMHALMAYNVIVYLGVVRRKEWPYFFRFHVILGVLLDMALDIIMIASGLMPLTAFWGKPGMVLWVATTSVYVLTVLECIRSALAGTYADISFLSSTAYVQTTLQ